MKAISDFVISVFELAEAEGRDLRSSVRIEAKAARAAVVKLLMSFAVLSLATALIAGGLWLVISGLHMWLELQVSKPMAAALAGLIVLGLAVGCLVVFRSMSRKGSN